MITVPYVQVESTYKALPVYVGRSHATQDGGHLQSAMQSAIICCTKDWNDPRSRYWFQPAIGFISHSFLAVSFVQDEHWVCRAALARNSGEGYIVGWYGMANGHYGRWPPSGAYVDPSTDGRLTVPVCLWPICPFNPTLTTWAFNVAFLMAGPRRKCLHIVYGSARKRRPRWELCLHGTRAYTKIVAIGKQQSILF